MLPLNTTLKDTMFGETWIVVSAETQEEECLYLIRNEYGVELMLAEWAVHYFQMDGAA